LALDRSGQQAEEGETREKDREKEKGEDQHQENSIEKEKGNRRKGTDKLQLRDWLALMIAALQTILLPVVLLLGVIFILTIIITILF